MAPAVRIVMLGTGDFAVPTFVHLIETGHEVVGLVTQPDRPQGRKQELIPRRIKVEALARGVPVLQPEDVNSPEGAKAVGSLRPDLLVTAAYGQILSAGLLGVPRLGAINLHGSVLPAYRGAAPVARAIERGEKETGVTVIRMSPRVDAGGMLSVARTPIGPDETAGEVEGRLAQIGAPLIAEAVAAIEAGHAEFLSQDKARVTRAPKLRKEDGLLDWSKPAAVLHNLVRAMQPWPGAFTYWQRSGAEPARLIVSKTTPVGLPGPAEAGSILATADGPLVVATGEGGLRLDVVQLVGKKPLPAAQFVLGHPVRSGDRMVAPP